MSTLTVIENETLPQALANEELTVTGAYRTAVHKGEMDGRVSEQWRNRPEDEKFLSLNDLKDFVFKRSQGSRDHLVRPGLPLPLSLTQPLSKVRRSSHEAGH